jgi:hypothetical protein
MHTVHVRVNDAATGKPTPCRVRFTDAEGRYYAPLGRLTWFATQPNEDVGGNLQLGDKKYAYIDGACEIQLPAGLITVEISKGFEYKPLSEQVHLSAGKLALRFTLERWADLRAESWYSGDVWVHAMTPHAALLEGAAEDVAVVNLLAEETMHFGNDPQMKRGTVNPATPNILAFSGQAPALERPGCMVVVNTANDADRLGHIALLNCHRPVFPLRFGFATDDQAAGWTVADWCDQCHRKGGLAAAGAFLFREHEMISGGTIMVSGELLADLILGKIDVVNVDALSGEDTLTDWRALLTAGFRVPLAGGSEKRSNRQLLGNPRTYAQLQPGQEFTYKNWIEAVRAGRTFLTNGPLLSFQVNGQKPGAVLDLPSSACFHIQAEARSLGPLHRLEVVCNGAVVASAEASGTPARAAIDVDLPLDGPAWLTATCRGMDDSGQWVAGWAHSSPIYVQIDGKRLRPDAATSAPLFAWLDKVQRWVESTPKEQSERDRQRRSAVFEAAKQELLRRQNAAGAS